MHIRVKVRLPNLFQNKSREFCGAARCGFCSGAMRVNCKQVSSSIIEWDVKAHHRKHIVLIVVHSKLKIHSRLRFVNLIGFTTDVEVTSPCINVFDTSEASENSCRQENNVSESGRRVFCVKFKIPPPEGMNRCVEVSFYCSRLRMKYRKRPRIF